MAGYAAPRKRGLSRIAVNKSRPLHHLIYCSRQQIPLSQLEVELADIVDASVRHNRKGGVTGLLLAHQGWFLQILEGPPLLVETTYGRIVNDRRHADSQVLQAAPIQQRDFGEWDMCARQLRREDDAILRVLDLKGPFTPRSLNSQS